MENNVKVYKSHCSSVMAALLVMGMFVMMTIVLALPAQLAAQNKTTGSNPFPRKVVPPVEWSVQVEKVDPGEIEMEPAFQIAIYENLLDELAKTKHFKQVLRSGDRSAADAPNLLILKTTVQKFTAGSETKRAVTTVAGATKLNVRSQLWTRDGTAVLAIVVNGDVHFFGSNLRATLNLAQNMAYKLEEATLPPIPAKTGEASRVSTERESMR